MATAKKVTDVIKSAEPAPQAEEKKPVRKKYEATDLIPVRSVTQGELLLPGFKSRILYRWAAYGDVTEVEYQDLYSLKANRSGYIYKPLFVIEDEELLSDPFWAEIKRLYDGMYTTSDISTVLALPEADFRKVLQQLPVGFQNAIKLEVATRLDDGTFDSIKKVKALDEILGTDLFCTIK